MYCFFPAEIYSMSIGRVLKAFRESLEKLHSRSWQHLNSFETWGMRVGFTCSVQCMGRDAKDPWFVVADQFL